MFINTDSSSIRFTGRWFKEENGSVTATAPGSMAEIAFYGNMAVLHFDVMTNREPYGHLWVSVDNGARVEVPLCEYIRVNAQSLGVHIIEIIYKSASEIHHRWYQPLEGKVTFLGYEADGEGQLPEDNRKIIEFIGDSITEGVAIDTEYRPFEFYQWNRPHQDDSAATYAFLTAKNLNLRPVIMGYGSVGITKSGCGAVPKAEESYPYCFDNAPYRDDADYIVINHGANDSGACEKDYISGYLRLIDLIRKNNTKAKIIVLSAFCGVFDEELGIAIQKYNAERNENIYFISSKGWAIDERLHPGRDGHIALAEKLSDALKEIL